MKKNSQRGFTLIELLVVIAIIGILASVVLASLNTARNKGADANIKANLANARAQAELYYDSNVADPNADPVDTSVGYMDVCTADGGIGSLVSAAATTAGATGEGTAGDPLTATTYSCANADDGSAWAAIVPLKVATADGDQDFYCVDSTGASKSTNSATAPTAGLTVCP